MAAIPQSARPNERGAAAREPRIPLSLQAVFLASNSGQVVDKPPEDKVASKVFFRSWLFPRKPTASSSPKETIHSRKGVKKGGNKEVLKTPRSDIEKENTFGGKRLYPRIQDRVARALRRDRKPVGTKSPPHREDSKTASAYTLTENSGQNEMLFNNSNIEGASLASSLSQSDHITISRLQVDSDVLQSDIPKFVCVRFADECASHTTKSYAEPVEEISPMEYLDKKIRQRGYSTRRYKTLQSAYYNKPTALQQASYDVYMIDLVQRNDAAGLRRALAAGLSPNPCNVYGESLVHLVCRKGAWQLLKVMIDFGCSLRVSDEFGRTPLHDACWASQTSFDIIDLILQHDIRLLHMVDRRGGVPLSYVRRDAWPMWIQYVDSKLDLYWRSRYIPIEGEQGPPDLCILAPNTCPLPDPCGALSVELAGMVAAGRLTPYEAMMIKHDDETDDDEDAYDEPMGANKLVGKAGRRRENDENESYAASEETESSISFDDAEMLHVLNAMTGPKEIQWTPNV